MKKFADTIIRLAVFAIIFVAMQIVAGVVAAVMPHSEDASLQLFVGYTLSMVLTFVAVKLYTSRIKPAPRSVMKSIAGFNPVITLAGVIFMVALSVVLSPLKEVMSVDNSAYNDSVWTLLTVTIIAPIFEEILFRGKLYNILNVSVSPTLSVLLSSLIFGVLHFKLAVFVSCIPLGFLFGFVYLRTRSIIAPIILHVCNNALAYALIVLSYNEQSLLELVDSKTNYILIYAVSAVVVLAGLVRFVTFIARYGKRCADVEVAKSATVDDAGEVASE